MHRRPLEYPPVRKKKLGAARPMGASLPTQPRAAAAPMLERIFYINSDASTSRRHAMEAALQTATVPYERWPAVLGSPTLNSTYAMHFRRGIEGYLKKPNGGIKSWGTIGNYLSHVTLFEHIASRRWSSDAASFLILQDDLDLLPGWAAALPTLLGRLASLEWQRVLLVWFGAERAEDCGEHACAVHPPAGPISVGGRSTRYYHGLQASIVRLGGVRCLLDCVTGRPIKAIDALLVHCDCPRTYALRSHGAAFGTHSHGSEKGRIDSAWRNASTSIGKKGL